MRITLLLISILFAACSRPETVEEPPDFIASNPEDNVPTPYKPFYRGGLPVDDLDTIRNQLPFDSISLRRTPCYGTCPVYEVVLHRNGKAEFHAEKFLPKTGNFVGEVPLFTYGRLCYFIEHSQFHQMNESYRANWTDDATCIVTVSKQGTQKAVSDYGSVGPIELWAIQELIDGIRNEIEWKLAQ